MRKISSRLPKWFEKWLKEPFHDGEKCTRHNRYKTDYCTACMEDPICSKCSEKSKKHRGHPNQILKVRRASGRVSVEVTDIRKFVDISEIQDYIINGFLVVFLYPNSQSSIAKHKPYCHTCQKQLIRSSDSKSWFRRKLLKSSPQLCNYKFCSIACKLEKEGRGMVKEKGCDGPMATCESWGLSSDIHDLAADDDDQVMIEGRLGNATINSGDIIIIKTDQQRNSFSYRKRSRKGPPRRAPFM